MSSQSPYRARAECGRSSHASIGTHRILVHARVGGRKLGAAILEFTKRELEGKLVKVFTWTTDNTAAGIVYENGNAFVQICYGGDHSVSFNELMLRKGYARVDTTWLPEDLQYYRTLEQEAREKRLGIWGE
jgi:endonuclease YncB( thermonuclease family)